VLWYLALALGAVAAARRYVRVVTSPAFVCIVTVLVVFGALLAYLGWIRERQEHGELFYHPERSYPPGYSWADRGASPVDQRAPDSDEPIHVLGGVPWLGSISTETADRVLGLTRRIFRSRRREERG
jgi:hypothetical protein